LANLTLVGFGITCCAACSSTHADDGEHEEARHSTVLTTPAVMDVPTSQGYVCQIHARRHIEVRALDEGYLLEIPIHEGQAVEQGQQLYKLLPIVYRARLDADRAELNLAEIHLRNTRQLAEQGVVSDQELALATAERDRARARVDLAAAEYGFTNIVAPFDGIVDRQLVQQGSLVEAGDALTTISDNSVMWVYFNVPEADYLEFKSMPGAHDPASPERLELSDATIELRLANGDTFGHHADNTLTIESEFDNETGNIQFRADFPNPERLLRHGQTGTLEINETLHDVLVIPQRATFEILDRQYVYVVGEDDVAHQREITVSHELDDIYVIQDGLSANERFVFEGVRHVREGEHLPHFELTTPEEALSDLKHHAE
jgi:membrane fusion protein (multidrug efflux system)